jgi:V-type H+-transporting ATPase subunit e
MGSFLHVIFVAIVCAALGAAGWFATPKGKNQT